ncbi:MAG: hypothetical protein RI983_822 [Bacteroidota bacterium]|jgi:hypothetical protein
MKRSQFIQSVALGALSVGLGDVFAQSKKAQKLCYAALFG